MHASSYHPLLRIETVAFKQDHFPISHYATPGKSNTVKEQKKIGRKSSNIKWNADVFFMEKWIFTKQAMQTGECLQEPCFCPCLHGCPICVVHRELEDASLIILFYWPSLSQKNKLVLASGQLGLWISLRPYIDMWCKGLWITARNKPKVISNKV